MNLQGWVQQISGYKLKKWKSLTTLIMMLACVWGFAETERIHLQWPPKKCGSPANHRHLSFVLLRSGNVLLQRSSWLFTMHFWTSGHRLFWLEAKIQNKSVREQVGRGGITLWNWHCCKWLWILLGTIGILTEKNKMFRQSLTSALPSVV